jgi:hypothetical protein
MFIRQLGAGFSDFRAAQTFSAGNTKLTAPMCTMSKMYNIVAFSFPGLIKVFLKTNPLKIDV